MKDDQAFTVADIEVKYRSKNEVNKVLSSKGESSSHQSQMPARSIYEQSYSVTKNMLNVRKLKQSEFLI